MNWALVLDQVVEIHADVTSLRRDMQASVREAVACRVMMEDCNAVALRLADEMATISGTLSRIERRLGLPDLAR